MKKETITSFISALLTVCTAVIVIAATAVCVTAAIKFALWVF